MNQSSVNNSRIAKNTLFLYARMLLGMCVSLFTSRVILDALGAVDYGIYNVVGSIVSMSAFLNGAITTSTQRYITFYLGKNEPENLRRVFCSSVEIHTILAIIVALLAETIGLWFFYNKLVIPPERMGIAFWVFQLSIITMTINIFNGPYNSAIVAHERMDIYAYFSLGAIFFQLFMAYTLYKSPIDRLLFYAILIAFVNILTQVLIRAYCRRHFSETRFSMTWDGKLMKEMGSFSIWNIWGSLAGLLFGQGLNILLNMFFGPVVNAARGVAVQVNQAIEQFARNFQIAVDPQITKSYANNELPEMHNLIFRASKFTFFMLFMLSLPVLVETDAILNLWLVEPPQYTTIFIRLTLTIVIIDSVARPLMTSAAATGRVKVYQSVVGGVLLTIAPIAYIVLRLGGNPTSVFVVHLIVCIIAFIIRVLIVKPLIQLSIKEYFEKTIARILLVTVASIIPTIILYLLLPDSLVSTITVCGMSVVFVAISSFFIGMTINERYFVINKAKAIISKDAPKD